MVTFEVNGINPVTYLADVLLRVQGHPASRIDEPLPQTGNHPKPSRPPEAGRRRTRTATRRSERPRLRGRRGSYVNTTIPGRLLGVRFEGADFVTQEVTLGAGADTALAQAAPAVSAFGLKGDWYFGTSSARPFVGLGSGTHLVGGGDMTLVTQAVGASTPTEVTLAKDFYAFEIRGTIGGQRTAH